MKDKKVKIIKKMRIPTPVLENLYKVGGEVQEAAVIIDSWQSRTFDKGKGIYKELDEYTKKHGK